MTIVLGEPASVAVHRQAKFFYLYMALSCTAVAFLGFLPTYWLPMAAGAFQARPIVHVHGMVFFAWTLLFVFQTSLATSGQIARHRAAGFIGVSLATAMTIFGTLVAVNQMRTATALGQPDAGKAFAIVPLGSIAFFAAVVAIAVGNVRRPDVHKRLML